MNYMYLMATEGYIFQTSLMVIIANKKKSRLHIFKSRSNFKVKVTRSKMFVPHERSCHKEYTCEKWKPYLYWFISYDQGLIFSKGGQTSMSRSQGKKLWHQVKGLVSRNTHVQYESHISSGLKEVAKVKAFQKLDKLQSQGHKVKNYGMMWKVLSQGIHMCNMEALSLVVRKLWPRLKFLSMLPTPMLTVGLWH